MPDAGDITRLLQEVDQGNEEAENQLFVLVEEDLRQIARNRKRRVRVRPDPDASTTVLVNDAFVRLIHQNKVVWGESGDRRKFFGFVANQIHCMLIDILRKQLSEKHRGDYERGELSPDVEDPDAGAVKHLELLIDLKEALLRMQQFAREDVILFRIRFFLECTYEETADIMGISKAEAVRSYQRTQLWLKRELKDYEPEP